MFYFYVGTRALRGPKSLARDRTTPQWRGPHPHRTALSSNVGARTAPQTSKFRPAPAPHRAMENVGPYQGPQ